MRENALAGLGAAVALYVVGWLTLYGWAWTDYDDEVRPAFDALVQGHVGHFLQLAPAYGGSLVLRAPFVLATTLWGGGEMSIYRAAAVPCLLASGVLGVWLVARMRESGRSRAARVLVLWLCVANPVTLHTLEVGHPEELLGAVLCVAAVLVALSDRPVWSGVLLGLAIANKQWALLAAGPVLIALPHHRVRAMLATAATAALILAPLMLTASSGVTGQGATSTGSIFQPWQAWWFLGSHGHLVRGTWGAIKVGYRTPPGWIDTIAHPMIVALVVPLTTLTWILRTRRGGSRTQAALLLLILLLALRCVLDPWDNAYYPLPFLIALVAWEALTFDRLPVLALTGSFVTWFVFQETAKASLAISPDVQSLIFLAAAIPALIAIALALYAPDTGERLTASVRRRQTLAIPA